MSAPQILVSHVLEPELREILKASLASDCALKFLPDIDTNARKDVISGAEVIISWIPAKEFAPEEYVLLTRLRLLQMLTAGADHVPFSQIPGRARIAANAGAFAEPMAEHIMGMALALAKRLCVNNIKLASGEFDQAAKNRMLRGLTFGVLGYGGIGKAAARLMRCLGLRIIAVNRSGRTSDPVEFAGTLDDLDHVLKNSDILLISLPLTKRSRGLIGRHELSLMKPDAMLINAARGAIVDEEALYNRLVENPLFSAAIDTWWVEPAMAGEFRVNYPFFGLPNFLGSPHNSPVVPGIMRDVVRVAAENAARFLMGEEIKGEVSPEDYSGE